MVAARNIGNKGGGVILLNRITLTYFHFYSKPDPILPPVYSCCLPYVLRIPGALDGCLNFFFLSEWTI